MSKPVRVLVVEDDPSMREALEDVLSGRGLEVVTASRGEEAILKARQETFDLIVADIRMDGLSGLDAIEQAQQLQPQIGSIVVSGFASEEETLRAVRLNVAGYLKKPFRIPDLLELMDNFLAKRAERLRQTGELDGLRDSLLWSLDNLGHLAEKRTPGRIRRAAELAEALSLQLGFAGDLPRQLRLGALMRRLRDSGELEVPERVITSLEPYPLLVGALRGDSSAEIAQFAAALCGTLEAEAEWPPAADLPAGTNAKIRDAYESFLAHLGAAPALDDVAPSSPSRAGLLGLGRALEGTGDREGARQAYSEAISDQGISQEAIQALLGLARLAAASADVREMEQRISATLAMAEQLGPVTAALCQLEAAEILRRCGHSSAVRLLERTVKNLDTLRQTFPWARAVLALHATGGDCEGPTLDGALRQLASPAHLLEVTERLESLLPDLLQLPIESLPASASDLISRLLRDFPLEVVGLLRRGSLRPEALQHLLSRLEQAENPVAAELLEALSAHGDPEIRARALALTRRQKGVRTQPLLRVYALGTLEVSMGDRRLTDKDWKTQKTKYLFARLADAAPRAFAVERLMEEFWPESEENARNNLNSSVSTIRVLLKGPDADPLFDPILRVGETVGLNPEQPLWYDAHEVETASDQARRLLEGGTLDAALSYFERVARLYRGPFLDGCYMDWAFDRRTRLENLVSHSLERVVGHRMEGHRYREGLEYALRILNLQPDNTSAHETVMKAYVGLGEHDKATSHYDSYATRLRADGLEPSIELFKVYQMARYGMQEQPGFTGT